MSELLNIHRLYPQGSKALGPGLRYIIWTQGCLQRCKGCLTPGSHSLDGNMLIEIESLADDITKRQYIEGITISGGEPFLQSEALTRLLGIVRQSRPELTVICFTGYKKENLTSPEEVQLLEHIDLLIDGPYVAEKTVSKGLKGSENQQLHFLTNRLLAYKEELEQGNRRREIIVGNKEIIEIGIP